MCIVLWSQSWILTLQPFRLNVHVIMRIYNSTCTLIKALINCVFHKTKINMSEYSAELLRHVFENKCE